MFNYKFIVGFSYSTSSNVNKYKTEAIPCKCDDKISVIASSSIEEKFDNPSQKEFVNESCINADIALWPAMNL